MFLAPRNQSRHMRGAFDLQKYRANQVHVALHAAGPRSACAAAGTPTTANIIMRPGGPA